MAAHRGRQGFLRLYRLHPVRGLITRQATAKGLYGDRPVWRLVWWAIMLQKAWKGVFGKQPEVVAVERLPAGKRFVVRTVPRDELEREQREAREARKVARAGRKAARARVSPSRGR